MVKYEDKMLNEYLFSGNIIDGDENVDERHEKAKELVSRFGWTSILAEWTDYLRENIDTRREAYNFATWVHIFDGPSCDADDPYPFLALLYKRLEFDKGIRDDLDERFDDPWERFTTLYCGMLVSCKAITLEDSYYLNPDEDRRLMSMVAKL